MRPSLLIAACLLTAAALPAQRARSIQPGTYSFLPRTSAYDPQFDAWRIQVIADSTRVIDPGGTLFIVSVTKMAGDTLQWTDVLGPCTGTVSRYKLGRDSIGITFDVIDDVCSDRANAIVTMYLVPVKASPDAAALDRPRRYTRLTLLGQH